MRAAVPSILRFASPSRAEDPDETLIGEFHLPDRRKQGYILVVLTSSVDTVGTVISAAEASRATGERQPSYGTIWSVGGAASSTGAVDDGHGRFFHRGTNARLFPASYARRASRSEDDEGTHESRLARALDIDRARRIIETDITSTPGHLPAIAATFRGHSSSKGMTIWNGVEWENSRSLKGLIRASFSISISRPLSNGVSRAARERSYAYSPVGTLPVCSTETLT